MKVFLRISALLSIVWVIVLILFRPMALRPLNDEGVVTMLADTLVVAHLGWAYVFWRGSSDPFRERTAVYTALLVLALRSIVGTYVVLYVLEGTPAMLSLIDMVMSTGLFVGILNTLPGVLRGGADAGMGGHRDA